MTTGRVTIAGIALAALAGVLAGATPAAPQSDDDAPAATSPPPAPPAPPMPPAPPAPPAPRETLARQATAVRPLVESELARGVLDAVGDLPAIETRVVFYDRTNRAALSAAAAADRDEAALAGYERLELDEQFYYFTRYGTPLAAVRPLDLAGRAGLVPTDGLRVLDFGFGSIGQLRLLASLGVEVTGIEVDRLLAVLYGEPTDTGPIPRAASAGRGPPGHLRLLFGQFPAEADLVAAAGAGYDLFISKNTLKRGYIHPERDVDPRLLVHLGVDDEIFVRTVYDGLAPGGLALIYNLCPPPSGPDEPYKPWADGRSPFARTLYEQVGFTVLAFDVDDTPAARALGRALGWGESMNLDEDLFGIYTLLRK